MLKPAISKRSLALIIGTGILVPTLCLSAVYAAATNTGSSTTQSTAAINLTKTIISKGNNEIARRLTTLNTLDTKIASSAKISSTDKTALTAEVNDEISGLGTTKTTLDGCTILSCAESAAQSIFTEYRVYLLVVPQVEMVKTADDQQLVEAKLMTMAGQLTTRLAKTSSSSLQADLTTINSDISAAQKLSSSVESSVEALTPQNYDNNHSILVQYYGDLKTAQGYNQAAYNQAKEIVAALKTSGSKTS